MNWEQIESHWDRVAGQVKAEWEKLTDDDLLTIAGKRPRLAARLQQRYGIVKGDIEKQINDWLRKLNAQADTLPPPAADAHVRSEAPAEPASK